MPPPLQNFGPTRASNEIQPKQPWYISQVPMTINALDSYGLQFIK